MTGTGNSSGLPWHKRLDDQGQPMGAAARTSSSSPRKPARQTVAASSKGSHNAGTGSRPSYSPPKNRKKTPSGSGKRPTPKKRGWGRKVAGWMLGLFLAGVIAVCGTFLLAYAGVEIPSPDKIAQSQTTTVYYADGKTKMGTFQEQDRQIIKRTEIPEYVGQAVVASEDRTFFENNGIDIKGIARALINNLLGRPRQGGSTLSQQYVENYYTGTTQPAKGIKAYTLKFKETILALKINRQQSKDEILGNYLNTIYWGRGAYGIEAAAQAYFNKSAKELSVSEAAMLAGIIPAPSAWDPATSLNIAQQRWQRVINNMVEDKWLSKDEAAQAQFPKWVPPKGKSSSMAGTGGYLLEHVRSELKNKAGYSDQQIDTAGFQIVTTINKDQQNNLVDAVNRLPSDHPANLRVGAVSVDNKTGGIIAEYGGAEFQKIQRSAAYQDNAMAGSTFKIFTLMGALEKGDSLYSTVDGSTPMRVGDAKISNFRDENFGRINYIQATQDSVNTAYVRINQKIGAEKTKEIAIKAGIPKNTPGLDLNLTNALGTASPHTIDLAQAYSTIANEGVKRDVHIVALVKDAGGEKIYKPDNTGKRVFDANVTAGATKAMQAVVRNGSGTKAQAIGRPAAAKTGSSENNRSAQFAGFVPQITTVISMYQVGKDGSEESISPFGGYNEITGGTWPAQVWAWYMKSAVANLPVQNFSNYSDAGTTKRDKGYSPSPSTPRNPEEDEQQPPETGAPEEDEQQPPETETPEEPEPAPTPHPSPTPEPSPTPPSPQPGPPPDSSAG
ncbi:MAG: transglycosylase domain-containing protein [Actinomycetaceae bacterium]|nr:transglycosylase domain-containing protein [Actinomycetaceae bacterium]